MRTGRIWLALIGAWLSVACGARALPQSGPTSAPAAAATASPEAQAPRSCGSADVQAGLGPEVPEPTGQHTLTFVLTNTSKQPCELFGYPGVALLDDSGQEIPFTYAHSGDQVVTSRSPRQVELQPSEAAYITINKYRCDVGDREKVHTVELLLPATASPIQLALSPTAMTFAYCGPGDPGSVVSVSPIAATMREALASH